MEEKFGVKCFQIHIHKDEGKTEDKLNLHAHMVFRWQDMETGKTKRVNKAGMSQLQTLVANTLSMDRGELKTNSNRERLEPIEYARQQEEIRLAELQEQTAVLEQKKNTVNARIREVRADLSSLDPREGFNEPQGQKEALRDIIYDERSIPSEDGKEFFQFSEKDINREIDILKTRVADCHEEIRGGSTPPRGDK